MTDPVKKDRIPPKFMRLKLERAMLVTKARFVREEELRWAAKANAAKAKQKVKAAEKFSLNHSFLSTVRLEVRRESRIHHLAHAFLRGLPYAVVEQKAMTSRIPIISVQGFWTLVADCAWKYSRGNERLTEVQDKVFEWRDQHPGRQAIPKGKGGTLADIKTYGDMWLNI